MTVIFETELVTTIYPDGSAQLRMPLVARCDGWEILVPVGFITDFGSVPRLPIFYAAFGNLGHRAAVLHDWLYSSGLVPRAKADEVLRAALIADGIPTWKAWAMWAGVRVFGARHYHK